MRNNNDICDVYKTVDKSQHKTMHQNNMASQIKCIYKCKVISFYRRRYLNTSALPIYVMNNTVLGEVELWKKLRI